MAKSIEWSPEALEDIESIAAYIERDSAHYARIVVSRIFESVALASEQPEIGREVPELGKPAIRDILVDTTGDTSFPLIPICTESVNTLTLVHDSFVWKSYNI